MQNPSLLRKLVAILLPLVLAPSAAAEALPRPASLEPAVRFWTRVYTEVDGNGGLIHDSESLDVVYETVRLSSGLSTRSRERRIEQLKDEYRAILRKLAAGRRSGLSEKEAAVLARWPQGTSNATLRRAADHVRFQLGQADKFRAGLVRAGRWRSYIEGVLAEHGVPVGLAALPHVESSYNPKAYSRVGAAGMWQFTRGTGRLYLRVDHVVDERLDPLLSTVAAARLLRDNYRRVQAWPLAITGYNHGIAGMERAARQVGTRDIGEIVRRYSSRSFGFASRNFYVSFLAALDIDRDPERFFGRIQPDPPVEYREVELPHYYPASALERAFGVDRGTLREANPALRPSIWNESKHVPRGYTLRLPKSGSRPVEVALARIPAGQRFAEQHRDRFYKVRRGDTLSRIASRYRVRESELVALNNLRSRHRIRVGQVLVLPNDAAGAQPVTVARAEPPADGLYRVRRGDTLSTIAARFGVSQTSLASANGLRNRHRIAVGQTLRLPGLAKPAAPEPAEPVAVVASAGRPTPPPAPKPEPPAPDPDAETGVEAVEGALAADDAEAPETEELAEAEPAPTPSSDPSNYAVDASGRVVVQADETLGHYAEWLEVRASDLRRVNGLRYGTPVVIGRRLKLDFARVSPETFERRRLAYHRSLQEEFFGAYVVTGTESHVLRRGESLWYLAERKYRLPVWLLRQYNPDLDFGALAAGTPMVIPLVEPRQG